MAVCGCMHIHIMLTYAQRGGMGAWSLQYSQSPMGKSELVFIIICMEICKSVAKANVKHDFASTGVDFAQISNCPQ